MKIMGIDPSTKTGVSLVGPDTKVLAYDEIEVKKAVGFDRASGIIARVMAFHEKHRPDLVVIEEMFVGHASSAITIIQIGTLLRYFLWQEGIKYIDVPATTLKKFVSGKGNSKKEEMMMHVLKRWGFTSPTNNIADAVGLGMFGLCCVGEKFDVASASCVKGVLSGLDQEIAQYVEVLRAGHKK